MDKSSSKNIKMVFIPIVFLIIMALFVIGAQIEYNKHITGEKSIASYNLKRIASSIESKITSLKYLSKGISGLVEINPNLSESEFMTYAAKVFDIRVDSSFYAIDIIKDTTLIYAYPKNSSTNVLNKDLTSISTQKDALLYVKNKGKSVVSAPVSLLQGFDALIGRSPISISDKNGDKKYWGQTSFILKYKELKDFLELSEYLKDFSFTLKIKEGFFVSSPILMSDTKSIITDPVTQDLDIGDDKWILEVEPVNGWSGFNSNFFIIILSGIVTSIFAAISTYLVLSQNIRLEANVLSRTKELDLSNESLKNALNTQKSLHSRLLASERQSTSNQLVSAISDEIDTPLGACITLTSHLELMRESLEKDMISENNKEKVKEITSEMKEISSIILKNLERVSTVTTNFKMVSQTENFGEERKIFIDDYINSVEMSLRPKIKSAKINIIRRYNKGISIVVIPGAFIQLLTQLFLFPIYAREKTSKESNATLNISSQENRIILEYSDSIKSMGFDKLYEIFHEDNSNLDDSKAICLHILKSVAIETMHASFDYSSTENGIKITIIYAW